jgi:hypothetical protein
MLHRPRDLFGRDCLYNLLHLHQMPCRDLCILTYRNNKIRCSHGAFDLVVGNRPFEAAPGWIGNGHCGNQLLCIGMLWVFEDCGAGSDFDDLTEIHDGDTMADPFDDRDIMRNK